MLGKQIIKFLKQKKYFQHRKISKVGALTLSSPLNNLNYGEFGECMVKAQLLCFQNQHIGTPFGYIQKLENQPDQFIKNKKLTLFKLHTFQKCELISCFEKSNILKSKNNSKADIFINNRGV